MTAKVVRLPTYDCTTKLSRGLGDETWDEPLFRALVQVDGETIAQVGNSSLLCLPGGSVRAPFATDAQILEAVLNDESVFD